jgi:carboxymethylenebutenolidase
MPDQEGFYLAEPSGPGRGGVLVVHDWYGLLPHVRTLCDELAAAGLAAMAPDLYDGRRASDPEQAEALMEAMDSAKAGAKLDAAIADLRERTGGGPVGGLGFSRAGSASCSRPPPGPSMRSPSTTPPWTRSGRPASTARSCSTSPSVTSSTLRRCSSSS